MKKLLQSLFVILCISLSAYAQDRTITGTVTAQEDNLPLPGVSVKIKGAKGGAVTGADGRYALRVPSGSTTLEFTYLGYLSESKVLNATSTINVQLVADTKTLSDVIVTGVAAGTSKEKLTISVTKIGEDRLNAVTASSIGNSLVGKVEGVRASQSAGTPGTSTTIQLRGNNNLPGVTSSPLIIIDGIIYNGDLSSINADDVESMEIVKGAASASLYGSRAGNGVLAITTKRGKNLSPNSTTITVRNEITLSELSKKLDLATHHAYKLAPDAGNFIGQYTKYAGVTYPAGYTGSGYNAAITGTRGYDTDHYADNDFGVVTDQQDALFKTGTNFTNYAAIASRSEKGNVFASFENNQQKGVVYDAPGYKRQNFRINADYQLAKWLKVSTSNLYINTSNSSNGGFWTAIIAEPDADLFQLNTDGQPYYIRLNQFSGEQTNPLYPNYKNQNKTTYSTWLGAYSANVKFTKWLNADISHTIEIQNYDYKNYNPKDTWNVDASAYTNGGLRLDNSKTNNQNTQATLNFNGKIEDLIINGKLSYLYENRKYDYSRADGSGGMSYADIPQLTNFITTTSRSSQEIERAQNYFAIASLDYKDRYLLDGMFRYDGSSLFGPDSRWNPYFRVSGAYRVSKDVDIPGIDELKVRGAYGTAGIRPGYNWQYEVYTLSSGLAAPSQAGNKALKPSKTTEYEVGLDVNFLKKFSFDATYAKSKTTDQFLNSPLLAFLSDGFTSRYINAGTVQSNTFEANMAAKWFTKPEFSWTSNITFTRVRQKITSLPRTPYLYGDTDGGGAQMFYIKEGEVYGAMYGNTWVTSLDQMASQLPTGKTINDYVVNSQGFVVDKGTEGLLTEKAIKLKDATGNNWYGKIGDGNSDFNIGLSNTFNYKGFSLYFLLDWKQGGDIYNSKAQWSTRDLRNGIVDQSGVAEGSKKTVDYYLNFYDVNNINSYWVEDASYLKFRELAIGYSIPKKILNNAFKGVVKGATAKLIGRNLFTITGYSGYDPEVGSVAQPYDGINKYPNYRSFGFSLSVDF
ncbi:SusC/RagA family TonB-linked outer membrane protein [Pedobacter fastidiosus]|uniref:SusC/RagA family TonB-linked outer membrane protein n=1 Tax=Pedobacter fastidiosus TaxID=2765361 RepID=A0ABR7KM79_9SPHI|nr:SusC/RagA family TonB-linked outer membrane protein [Pedobacter fastidiosus]MBC6109181.1 SusC/RagA family TonB-linked outer membrane protein [Pedobacter fastidiosus]